VNRCGNGTGSFEVNVWMDRAKLTNMITARFGDSRDMIKESEKVITKGEAQIAS